MDKMSASLLKVPYVHCVFTLPHQLNGLARNNEKSIYSLILRVAWLTVRSILLHTFGSDLKYHIHVHALVTFGGLSVKNQWRYPSFKDKLDRYRTICSVYKKTFIHELLHLYNANKINYHQPLDEIIKEVEKIRWVVHSTRPTMNTKVLEHYLARYINRVAISNNRLQYIKNQNRVIILYNDYKNQQKGHPAPKAYKELNPLLAIHQILQHVLPPHFQKSRRYGLHHHALKNIYIIPDALRREPLTIRTLFQIITELSKQKPFQCEVCGSTNLEIDLLIPDSSWIFNFIDSDNLRAPPEMVFNTKPILTFEKNPVSSGFNPVIPLSSMKNYHSP